jgi:hypothetical protein
MKPPGLGYQKIDICLAFCMLYYSKHVNLTEWKLVGMLGINPIRVEEEHLSHMKN